MSPALLQAIVLSEDRRFYEHSGVDWRAVAPSAWANAVEHAHARRLDADDAARRPARRRPGAPRRRPQRGAEARPGGHRARSSSAHWKKSEILEAYLNRVPFRGELVGINALSQTLFGKHPSGLDAQRGRDRRGAGARAERQRRSAWRSAPAACSQLQRLPCDGIDGADRDRRCRAAAACRWANSSRRTSRARPSTRAARRCSAARSTPACSAWRIDDAAPPARRAERPQRRGRRRASCSTTPAARCSPGSAPAASRRRAAQVDGVLARRQPGSTLKPFVYELAFEQRLITPASLLDDSPAQIATAAGLYLPQNYDRDFKGWVSARTALGAQPERAGGARGRDARARRAVRAPERASAWRCARAAATTATRWRWAAPTSRCWR